MSRWQVTMLLAGWEFRRYFKWKSQLISMSIMALFMVGLAVVAPRLVVAFFALVGRNDVRRPLGLVHRDAQRKALGSAPHARRQTAGLEHECPLVDDLALSTDQQRDVR